MHPEPAHPLSQIVDLGLAQTQCLRTSATETSCFIGDRATRRRRQERPGLCLLKFNIVPTSDYSKP